LNYFLPKVILSSAFLDHLNDPEKFFSALIWSGIWDLNF
jgi:hypothetical protein